MSEGFKVFINDCKGILVGLNSKYDVNFTNSDSDEFIYLIEMLDIILLTDDNMILEEDLNLIVIAFIDGLTTFAELNLIEDREVAKEIKRSIGKIVKGFTKNFPERIKGN